MRSTPVWVGKFPVRCLGGSTRASLYWLGSSGGALGSIVHFL